MLIARSIIDARPIASNIRLDEVIGDAMTNDAKSALRHEIGKYVDDDEVARLERYVYIR